MKRQIVQIDVRCGCRIGILTGNKQETEAGRSAASRSNIGPSPFRVNLMRNKP
jgi:hypothetical protein